MNFRKTLLASISYFATHESDRAALFEGDRAISYLQLRNLVANLSAVMSENAKSERIGVFMENSVAAYGAILSIVANGATYVPLPVKDSLPRLREIIRSADLSLIVTTGEHIPTLERLSLKEGPPVLRMDAEAMLSKPTEIQLCPADGDLYLMFTSGSTGRPKGVVIADSCVDNFVSWAGSYFAIKPYDQLLGHTPITFDLSVFNLFTPFFYGASVRIAGTMAEQTYPGDLLRQGVTLALMIPRITAYMLEGGQLEPNSYPTLRHVLFCGENLPAKYVNRWLAAVPLLTVHNLYGPTEATVACSCFSTATELADGPVPIGKALPNMTLRLASEDVDVGELIISGAQVSRQNYWREGAGGFFADVEFGQSFRSGDLVRSDEHGLLYWLSRLDDQIKIRGHRVELSEIEICFASHPQLLDVVCVFDSATQELALFVQGEAGLEQQTLEIRLREYAAERLPPYMRPANYLVVAAVEKNAHGKVDRRKMLQGLQNDR